uniref:MFS domain-containing protein n=1 Tax=Mesocestoides corti TaxID=53468 RepID=A0A5K3FW40_MESCO
MSPYIISYLHENVDECVDHAYSIWLAAGSSAMFGITMPLSGMLWKKMGLRRLVLSACLLNSISVFVSSFTINANFGLFFFTYAILASSAVGIGYGLSLQAAITWFPKNRGLVMGICAVGFGSGVSVLAPVQTLLINPNNKPVSPGTKIRSAGSRPHLPTNHRSPDLKLAGDWLLRSSATANQRRDLRRRRHGNTKDGRTLALPAIQDDRYLTLVGALGGVFNTLSRLIWGCFVDRISFKAPLCLVNVIYAAVLASLPYIPWIAGSGRYLYGVWITVMFLCVGGNFLLISVGVTARLGLRHFAENYGIVYTARIPASIISAAILSSVNTQLYAKEAFYGCGAIALLSAVLCVGFIDVRLTYCATSRRASGSQGEDASKQTVRTSNHEQPPFLRSNPYS